MTAPSRSNLPCPHCNVPLNVTHSRLYSTRVRLRRRTCPECDYVEPSVEIPLDNCFGDVIRFREGLLSVESPLRVYITSQPVVSAQVVAQKKAQVLCPGCEKPRPPRHRNPYCTECHRKSPEYKKNRAAKAYHLRQPQKTVSKTPQIAVCGSCKFGGSLLECDFDFPEAFTKGASDCAHYSPTS